MIFRYNELKEYVNEDFDRFFKMGFDERQILPAVLNEYEYGEDFCQTENICIHILLGINYSKKEWSISLIREKLEQLLRDDVMKNIENELGCDYAEFISDLDSIMAHITHPCLNV